LVRVRTDVNEVGLISRLLDVVAQLKCSAHAALGLAINCCAVITCSCELTDARA